MAYVKRAPASSPEATLIESAGLRWLGETQDWGGARVVEVLDAAPGELRLEEITTTSPTTAAAARFGEALAITHRSLNPHVLFGTLPPDHPREAPALFGPADQPLVVGSETHGSWGAFHAAERLDPVLELLRGAASPDQLSRLTEARDRIAAGEFDDGESPSRLHGDLWSGNILWQHAPDARTPGSEVRDSPGAGAPAETNHAPGVDCVLIDPMAHAGHRETDLAMLCLFGMPHLDTVLKAYERSAPLREGWKDRIPVHQFFYLAVHWLLFGPAYEHSTMIAADRTLAL